MDENGRVDQDARDELDSLLQIRDWSVLPGRVKVRAPDVPAGVPSWWISDEEASQSTLAAVQGMTVR